MAFGVLDAVDRLVAAENEERAPDGAWHPSSIFGCARKAIYEARGTTKSNPPDERALRIFRLGNIIHEYVQRAILGHPDVIAVAIEPKVFDPARNIKGSVDALVLFGDGSWRVVEIKSINSMAMRYKDLPKPDHRLQAGAYLLTLRDYGAKGATIHWRWAETDTVQDIPPLGDGAKFARLAYVSKDDMVIEESDLVLDESLESDIVTRVELLDRHQANGTLPMRLPDVRSKAKADNGKMIRDPLCRYCPYMDTCWKVDPEGVA